MLRRVNTTRLASSFQNECAVRVHSFAARSPLFHQLPRYGLKHFSNTSKPQFPEEPQPRAKPTPKRSNIGRNAIISATGILAGWLISSNFRQQAEVPPDGFVKYTLTDRQKVSPTCSIFSLKPPSTSTAIELSNPTLARAVTSVEFKQPQLQIARSYTILPPAPGQADDELRFLIRKERNGEVSGYLHRLPIGADIEVRGPFVESALPDDVGRVVFVAGGTGIAPAMRVAHALKDDARADVRVLWANRKREDCIGGEINRFQQDSGRSWWKSLWGRSDPSRQERVPQSVKPFGLGEKSTVVEALDQVERSVTSDLGEKKIQVDYFVDEEGTFIKPDIVRKLLQQPTNNSAGRDLLFVSGPEGFITYWAGAKEWVNGREIQGPIRGEIGKMQPVGWTVVKL